MENIFEKTWEKLEEYKKKLSKYEQIMKRKYEKKFIETKNPMVFCQHLS